MTTPANLHPLCFGDRPEINLVIAANTYNYNIRTAALAAGWDGNTAADITVTVNAGVMVGSLSTSTPAMIDSTVAWPAGTTVKLVNYGWILGRGGNGGSPPRSTNHQYPGFPSGEYDFTHTLTAPVSATAGGPALQSNYGLQVQNLGVIAGGGGGGGASDGTDLDVKDHGSDGAAGGGGAGYPGGSNGYNADLYRAEWGEYFGDGNAWNNKTNVGTGANPGSRFATAGTTAAGLGGIHTTGNGAYNGGNGGELGSTGGTGGDPEGDQYHGDRFGKAGGPAVIGNANITWLATGTRYGAIT